MSTESTSFGAPRISTSSTLWMLFAADVAVALWCATQVVAHSWQYHPRLGPPLVAVADWPVYVPYRVLVWAIRYRDVPGAAPALEAGLQTFCGVLLVAVVATFSMRRGRRPRRPSTSHGTARWGTGETLRTADGFLLGRLNGYLLRYSGDGHLVTVAPTRAGKGVGVVIPNLLTYPGSIIVTDPKAENFLVTSRRRRELRSEVFAFDPFMLVQGTAAFNPLDLIDAQSKDANDDARMLADMLVVLEGKEVGEQAFWNEEARALLSGLILHVVTSAEPAARHLPRVRELLTLPPDEFAILLKEMSANTAAGGLVSRAAARLQQKAEKERSGVISSAQAHTHFLDSPRMADVLSTSTVNLNDLLASSVTYYLILPPDRLATYQRWLRLMIACCLIIMTRQATRRDRIRLQHRVLFLLDEFGQLGRMQPVERNIALVGGYGVSFWLLLQDIAQLKAIYPEKWQSFLANADVLQTFGTADWDTAEHISKLTGDATIHVESDNVSRGVSHGKSGGRQESAARTVSEKGRRLLLPDEVRRLPRSKQLIFLRHSDPLCTDLVSYLNGEFAGLYDPNPLVA